MRETTHQLALPVVLIWLASTNLAVGQGPVSKMGIIPNPFVKPFPQENRDLVLKVSVHPQVPKARVKAYKQVADYLNKAEIGVPNDREQYFRTVISPNSPLVIGWHGFVEMITPVESGILVTIRVTARQEGVMDSISLIEQYSIVNGQVSYVGAVIPQADPRIIIKP